jgi:hypothetical protein
VLGLGIAGLAGCAIGQAEFKVIKSEPGPPPLAGAPAATSAAGTTLTAEVPAPAAAAGETGIHIVRPGESLWRISRRLLGDPRLYPRVAAENHLGNPNLLQPGQKLIINTAWRRVEPPPVQGAPAVTPPPQPAEKTAAIQAAAAAAPRPPAVTYPSRDNTAFLPGESLTFSVEYFGIAAGIATLDVATGEAINGRPVLHLVATARTHPAFEWIFKVRDRIESFFDAQGLFSWRYEKHLREGSYSNDSVLLYDQPGRKVIKDEGRTVVPAPAWAQDVLSEFYFFRTQAFQVGDSVNIPVVADDGKTYEVLVSVLRRETVTGPAGTFACLVVSPALKFEGLFQQKGKILIWVTDDAHRVPVLIKSQIVIGTIDVVLRNATVVEK